MSRVYDGVDRRAMKIRSWECTDRGKVQMSRAGGTPWVYMQEERETLPETAIGMEFLVVVGRYRVAFRYRGVYGREGDSKSCEF